MSFIDFLLKYYIWILGVLILLILIVIGILVDSKSKDQSPSKTKKKDKKKDKTAVENEATAASAPLKEEDSLSMNTIPSMENVSLGNGNGVQNAIEGNVNPLQTIANPSATMTMNSVVEQAQGINSVPPVNPAMEQAQSINPVPSVNPVMEQPQSINPVPMVNSGDISDEKNSSQANNNEIFTTNGAQPFDINSMFANNK